MRENIDMPDDHRKVGSFAETNFSVEYNNTEISRYVSSLEDKGYQYSTDHGGGVLGIQPSEKIVLSYGGQSFILSTDMDDQVMDIPENARLLMNVSEEGDVTVHHIEFQDDQSVIKVNGEDVFLSDITSMIQNDVTLNEARRRNDRDELDIGMDNKKAMMWAGISTGLGLSVIVNTGEEGVAFGLFKGGIVGKALDKKLGEKVRERAAGAVIDSKLLKRGIGRHGDSVFEARRQLQEGDYLGAAGNVGLDVAEDYAFDKAWEKLGGDKKYDKVVEKVDKVRQNFKSRRVGKALDKAVGETVLDGLDSAGRPKVKPKVRLSGLKRLTKAGRRLTKAGQKIPNPYVRIGAGVATLGFTAYDVLANNDSEETIGAKAAEVGADTAVAVGGYLAGTSAITAGAVALGAAVPGPGWLIAGGVLASVAVDYGITKLTGKSAGQWVKQGWNSVFGNDKEPSQEAPEKTEKERLYTRAREREHSIEQDLGKHVVKAMQLEKEMAQPSVQAIVACGSNDNMLNDGVIGAKTFLCACQNGHGEKLARLMGINDFAEAKAAAEAGNQNYFRAVRSQEGYQERLANGYQGIAASMIDQGNHEEIVRNLNEMGRHEVADSVSNIAMIAENRGLALDPEMLQFVPMAQESVDVDKKFVPDLDLEKMRGFSAPEHG